VQEGNTSRLFLLRTILREEGELLNMKVYLGARKRNSLQSLKKKRARLSLQMAAEKERATLFLQERRRLSRGGKEMKSPKKKKGGEMLAYVFSRRGAHRYGGTFRRRRGNSLHAFGERGDATEIKAIRYLRSKKRLSGGRRKEGVEVVFRIKKKDRRRS